MIDSCQLLVQASLTDTQLRRDSLTFAKKSLPLVMAYFLFPNKVRFVAFKTFDDFCVQESYSALNISLVNCE